MGLCLPGLGSPLRAPTYWPGYPVFWPLPHSFLDTDGCRLPAERQPRRHWLPLWRFVCCSFSRCSCSHFRRQERSAVSAGNSHRACCSSPRWSSPTCGSTVISCPSRPAFEILDIQTLIRSLATSQFATGSLALF